MTSAYYRSTEYRLLHLPVRDLSEYELNVAHSRGYVSDVLYDAEIGRREREAVCLRSSRLASLPSAGLEKRRATNGLSEPGSTSVAA